MFGTNLENLGANYLMKKLAAAGGVTAPGDPIVTQLYCMRFQDDFPAFSLVINGAPYPPYWAIQYRSNRPPPAPPPPAPSNPLLTGEAAFQANTGDL